MSRATAALALLLIVPGCFEQLMGGSDGGDETGSDTPTDGTSPSDPSDPSDPTDPPDPTDPAGTGGWTLIPLLDDESDPSDPIWHAGNDLVTGIHFSSLDEGLVVTAGDEQTFQDGGAIFSVAQHEVTGILFSGATQGRCLLGSVDFVGLVPTADGYVAMAHACDHIASTDGGASFDVQATGVGDPFGIESVIGYAELGGRTVLVRDTGVVDETTGLPGPNAIWDTIWAPQAVPTTPNPVPPEMCQYGPNSGVPETSTSVYIAPDGNLIAYTSAEYDGSALCISRDGGASFYPHLLQGLSEDVMWAAPSGVLFTSDTVGITWFANSLYPDGTYIQRTTDGGETWSPATLPPELEGVSIELRNGFFAPGGSVGFIVGYDYDHDIALLIKTTDGGASWTRAGGDLAQIVSDAGGGKLWSGFALDEDHIWVGGEAGILVASDNGGD